MNYYWYHKICKSKLIYNLTLHLIWFKNFSTGKYVTIPEMPKPQPSL